MVLMHSRSHEWGHAAMHRRSFAIHPWSSRAAGPMHATAAHASQTHRQAVILTVIKRRSCQKP